jgi:thiamine transporter
MFKLVEMPYGGSVTAASMFPILLISYRHGIKSGLASGLVYAAIQQLLGLNNLSYVTGWQSVIAVIMLDYIIAFAVIGLGGILKGKISREGEDIGKRQARELALGMLFVCLLRYICHTVAGATVWAGLSIPTEAALIYSIGYNATYMIPETIVNVLVSAYIGGIIDLGRDVPTRIAVKDMQCEQGRGIAYLPYISALIAVIGVIVDIHLISSHLQDPESGSFTFALLGKANWVAVIIFSAVCLAGSVACALFAKLKKK